jgi:SAM-dependent methyltransferase
MVNAHRQLVANQFGPHAEAYVASEVHAAGADLIRLAALIAARPGRRALDLGCGGGHVSYVLAAQFDTVVAYDLSQEMTRVVQHEAAARALRAIDPVRGAVEALPFADASFDLVATRFSAHHWSDLGQALAEMRRVLKPDGRAIVMDTIAPARVRDDTFLQAVELLRDPSHVRNYSLAEWHDALTAAGFTPGQVVRDRLRLDFASWVSRIGTPPAQIAAIRALQAAVPGDVTARFDLEADGSFLLDTMMIEADIPLS